MKKRVLGILAALFVCAVLLPLGVRATDADAANVYAILYDDGTLVFQHGNTPEPGRTVTNTYAVDLTANYTNYPLVPWNNERESIRIVDFADRISPTSTAFWFEYCSNLKRVYNIRNLDTANVTNMGAMFSYCSSLTALDVSHFDTANVTDMGGMFYDCSSLTALDVSHFDTANVTDMGGMFYGCSGLTALDVSHFDTANVTYMENMFSGCSGLTALDVSNFNTANVTTMRSMFLGCSGLTALDVSNFNTANVTYMVDMFSRCAELRTLDISSWDTANVTGMSFMFFRCSNLKTIYSSERFVTSSVISGEQMFDACQYLSGGNGTRYNSNHMNVTYARIDTPSTPGYFTDKNSPLISPSGLYAILYDDGTLVFQNSNTPLSGESVTMTYPVDLTKSYTIGVSSSLPWYPDRASIRVVSFADTVRPTSMRYWFRECRNLERIDNIHNLDTSYITNMKNTFFGCSSLTTLDVSGFDTSSVKDMSGMFSGCSSLVTLDVSHSDVSNVTVTGYMFRNCASLKTLDLSNWDTSKVRNMDSMFSGSSNLTTIYVSEKFIMASSDVGHEMFRNCTSLVGGSGTKYDNGHTAYMYARIDTASAPGYFTAKEPTPVTYTVTWRNYDGTVLRTDRNVVAGTVPTYDGEAPVRTGYRFTGWSPQPSAVTGDVAYTAQFTEVEQLFDVRRDAYAFGNSMQGFGYTSRGGPGGGRYPIPAQSFYVIFGESVRAKMLYMRESSKAWGGNCAGMASSAALLFAYGQLNPADFGKSNTYSLEIGDKNAEMSVLTLVEALQIAQFTDAFGQARQANQVTSGQSLNGLYQTIKDEIGQGRPTLLAVVKNGVGGHALLAVGADDAGNRILIYDCNHPGELRYMTLSADRTAWSYDMGGYGVWGSDSGACSISYVPYAVLEDIWANRGNLRQTSQVLTVNAENVSITNFDGDTVASLEDGQLVTSTEGVYELFDLSMYWPEERSICLPRNEVYTVSTSDDITLSASMTDSHMSAEITTSAHTVTFGVSDDEKENSVVVQGATASDTYSITLESDFDDLRHKNLTLTGTGQGENVNVSMTQDGVTFVNCNIESLSLDACKIVSAARGRDGKLSVTLTNPNSATLAVSYFDANGKFMSANMQAVAADAGTVSVDIPAGAATASVMLFDSDCRPLCAAREADFSGGAG